MTLETVTLLTLTLLLGVNLGMAIARLSTEMTERKLAKPHTNKAHPCNSNQTSKSRSSFSVS